MDRLSAAFRSFWHDVVELIPGFLVGLAVIVLAILVGRKIQALVKSTARKYGMDRHTAFSLSRITNILVVVVGIIIGLGVMGVNLTALMATVGLVGFAVGFALQGILSNFLAGLTMMLQRPFSIGDAVAVGSTSGIVTEIRLRDTVLRTFDGSRVIIPNQTVFSQIITNYTANGRRRVDIPLSVGRDHDLARIFQIAGAAVKKVKGFLADPEPLMLVNRFTDGAAELEIRFWVDTQATDVDQARSEAWQSLRDAFQEAEIPVRAR